MKTLILTLTLAGLLAGTTGCVVAIGASKSESQPPPQVLTSSEAATIAEIDAASKLSFDAAKLTALIQITRLSDLSPAVQLRLVEAAYKRLSFADSKVALLREIIISPNFCDATRQAIVTQLQMLPFDANKQEVLNELNRKVTSAAAKGT